MRLGGKTAVCPKPAFATEAMGCLQYGRQPGGANRTDRRNLLKQISPPHACDFPATALQRSRRICAGA